LPTLGFSFAIGMNKDNEHEDSNGNSAIDFAFCEVKLNSWFCQWAKQVAQWPSIVTVIAVLGVAVNIRSSRKWQFTGPRSSLLVPCFRKARR
jgi:hypothetical protein